MAYKKPPTPPCPDPEKYVLVRGKYKNFWRKKRFYGRKGIVNDAFKDASRKLGKSMPFTLKILYALEPFTWDLRMDWIHTRMNGMFIRSMKKTSKISMSALTGLDFQKMHPFRLMLTDRDRIKPEKDEKKGLFRVKIWVGNTGAMRKTSNQVAGYSFTLILIHGKLKPEEARLQFSEVNSRVYPYGVRMPGEECVLELPLPPKKSEWLLLLRGQGHEKNGEIYPVSVNKGMLVLEGSV